MILNNVLVRKFTPADVSTIRNLVFELFKEDYSESMLLKYHNTWENGFLVGVYEHKIVGVLLATLIDVQTARILIFGVAEAYRKRKIGTQLITMFTNYCVLRNIKYITLEVRVSNTIAINFYTSLGYTITNIIPKYYRDGENCYVMQKILF